MGRGRARSEAERRERGENEGGRVSFIFGGVLIGEKV